MRFIHFLDVINEAKFRKPIEMYHGTSDAFLRSILKQGILPVPPGKVWDEDPDSSAYMASRASLEGSYWTSNLMTASSAAWNTAKKFPGNKLFVIANIAEQSAFADEDSINSWIDYAFADAARLFNMNGQAVKHMASIYFNDWEGAKSKILHQFMDSLHGYLKASPDHPMDPRFLKEVFEAYLMRGLAHAKKDEDLRYFDTTGIPDIPSVREAEKRWLEVREALTRHYTKSAYKTEGSTFHTLRMTEPVNFKGANKIIGIIGEPPRTAKPGQPDVDWYSTPLILYYGKATDDFLEQYRQRVGAFPGLVDPKGKMVIPSEREAA